MPKDISLKIIFKNFLWERKKKWLFFEIFFIFSINDIKIFLPTPFTILLMILKILKFLMILKKYTFLEPNHHNL